MANLQFLLNDFRVLDGQQIINQADLPLNSISIEKIQTSYIENPNYLI